MPVAQTTLPIDSSFTSMDPGLDMSAFGGFDPDKVLAELVELGQLDRRLIGTAWCNREKKSRLLIIQKLLGALLLCFRFVS